MTAHAAPGASERRPTTPEPVLQRTMDMRPPPGVPQAAAGELACAGLPPFRYAFQPIVDVPARQIHGQEALIRGLAGEPAQEVLLSVPQRQRHRFDQYSRAAAIALAARIGYAGRLHLNFLPQSVDASSAAIRHTANAAARHGIALERIVLEVTELGAFEDPASLVFLINEYRGMGMMLAIDDFGAGYCGLNLLSQFQPDAVKIDPRLVRGIELPGPRQAVVRAILQAGNDLGVDVIAEGVQTAAEYAWLAQQGLRLYQGSLFAEPGLECLPAARFPARAGA